MVLKTFGFNLLDINKKNDEVERIFSETEEKPKDKKKKKKKYNFDHLFPSTKEKNMGLDFKGEPFEGIL